MILQNGVLIDLPFLIMTKNKLFALGLSLVLLNSCGERSDFEKIETLYYASGKSDFDQYQYIVLINEEGKCISCNNIFAQSMSDDLQNNKVLFILSGTGTKIDISAYANSESENVLMDYNREFKKLAIVNQCAVLTIADGNIASMVKIDIHNVLEFTSPFHID